MRVQIGFFLIAAYSFIGSNTLIIPDELPSILSVIYSNIPTLKKGTDSRIGWGFRLGERADFQVLVELGPQTNTRPLANQNKDDGTSKRSSLNTLAETLYAQRQLEKKEKLRKKEEEDKSNSTGKQWLQNWSKSVTQADKVEPLPLNPKPGIAIGEIDAKSVIPDDETLERMELAEKNKNVKVLSSDSEKKLKKPTVGQSLVSILTSSENATA